MMYYILCIKKVEQDWENRISNKKHIEEMQGPLLYWANWEEDSNILQVCSSQWHIRLSVNSRVDNKWPPLHSSWG
jgi:hypothetical protein